jgi:HK97 family phage portal protein
LLSVPLFSSLKSLLARLDQKSVSYADWPFTADGSTTLSRKLINPAAAMRVPAVASATELISELVGTLPAKLFVRAEDGSRSSDTENPAYWLIHDEANDFTSATALRTQLTCDALLNDNGGFAFANRVDGRVVEFIRLAPHTVTVKTDEVTGEPVYLVGQGAQQRRHHYRDILHIQAFGGCAPITRAREAIGLALTLEAHAARLFGNGAQPSGTINYPKPLTSEAAKNLLSMWTSTHGNGNSGKPALLADGATWTANALTSVDAQFLEMRRFQTEEIARAFRVPPTMLFDLERGTWANTEQMARQFLTHTLRPWLDAWQWAYARVLLTPEERRTHYVEFITDDLLSADFAARMEGYSKAISARILNPNEARAAENRPPYAGGQKFENPNTTAANLNAVPKDKVA